MTDWQKGDLALRTGPTPPPSNFRKGRVYTVSDVRWACNEDGSMGYGIAFACGTRSRRDTPFLDARGFRKITPPKADEFDREVIDLMNRKTVEA